METAARWWTWLLAPWRQARDRDDWDIDLLNALHRLDTRVTALEREVHGRE